ncbi:MAG TPA: Uma2 family endonuclease [Verrucomicrobiae bacterium]|nr:Uma2 family endonuclease [Verrucomicrobiae bacterium]
MSVAESVRKLTEAEYLALERAAEFKSEFFAGEMFAMAGGTPEHSLIAANVIGELRTLLKGSRWVVFDPNLRLKIEATGLYTYPDATVVCGPRQHPTVETDVLVNPILLVEVLSDSTEAYDRGTKFDHYQKIPSLGEYLLVRQKDPCVEQCIRQPSGDWLLRQATGLEATLTLPSLEITIALSEIYANVKFVPTPIRPPTPPRA